MRDEYILFVRDPRTRTYRTDGAVYATEADALLALGNRAGYVVLRRAWTREFKALSDRNGQERRP